MRVFGELTECEAIVMKIIWNADKELCLMDVLQRASEEYHKTWRPQTVSTFLVRLVKKGFLQSYREGRVFYYQILVPFKDYRQQVSKEFFKFWYHGSSTEHDLLAAIDSLINQEPEEATINRSICT